MLKTVRDLTRHVPQQFIFTNRILKDLPPATLLHCRTLYAENTLGVDGFRNVQGKIQSQFSNMTDRFRGKMEEFSSESSSNMIFTEDLKNMIHLAKNTPEDVDLVRKMLVKFNKQNKEVRFGNYVFGPVLMRMFYCMGNVDVPLELYRNPDFQGFFDQVASYQIMFDMLYEKGKYQDVLNLFSECKNESLKDQRHLVVLVMAACYKINSPDALNYAVELWSRLTRAGKEPMRRASTLAAGLALKQNNPAVALEIVSSIRQHSYMTVRNIKILAMAKVNRFEEALVNLKGLIEVEVTAAGTKQSICQEVLDQILEIIRQNDNKELLSDAQRVYKFLKDHGHVTEKSLDDFLTSEITVTNVNATRPDKSILAGSFRANPPRKSGINPRFVRPGLAELN
uniref:Pentacotripeptide-repeat region of PRORP domain-containing protein n=1 Tax=Phlebotomus papatasi TaxID=29031 RepID=A0A1B0DDZ8_PHLPP